MTRSRHKPFVAMPLAAETLGQGFGVDHRRTVVSSLM
jgi:hypothetical protein